ncbi:MAG: 23S rRNA (guanosine(2251)-2'-O)-methyltransferase RlmB [Vicinamibacterales bacterium]
MVVFGINPVREALRAGHVRELRVAGRADDRVRELLRLAEQHGIRVRRVDGEQLARDARGGQHQGVVADVEAPAVLSVADLVAGAGDPPLLVVLDSIEDPQNVGAILRTVDAAGADGVVVQQRRSAALGGAASKASAGALAHVRIAEVVNIARALDELKTLGVWTIGLAGDAPSTYDALDLAGPTALVFGAEGTGLRRLVKERCDLLAAIPMQGHVDSLNVSVAAGVTLFEAVRQRRAKARRPRE